jgi:hypothetical protein
MRLVIRVYPVLSLGRRVVYADRAGYCGECGWEHFCRWSGERTHSPSSADREAIATAIAEFRRSLHPPFSVERAAVAAALKHWPS